MKLKQIILNTVAMLALTLVPIGLQTVPAYAAGPAPAPAPSCGTSDSAKGQVLQGVGLAGDKCDDKQVNQVFQTVVQILTLIVGATSVIVIMYAGFKYISSGGEANKVANAKSTLLYALVGLAVAGLTEFLIHFVLFEVKP